MHIKMSGGEVSSLVSFPLPQQHQTLHLNNLRAPHTFLNPSKIYTQTHSKGFTLVELIVVIVILGILLALAIPALTGYIKKAERTDAEFRMKTTVTALQAMVDEEYAKNGDFKTYLSGGEPAGSYYAGVSSSYVDTYSFLLSSPEGCAELEALTTGGAITPADDSMSFYIVSVSPTGRIKSVFCGQSEHFGPESDPNGGELAYYWIEDMTDPGTAAWLAGVGATFPGILSTFTDGLNSYKANYTFNTFEKLL
jgi:prepilin-type N-terminal cleavage/methylation domain-containing protein